MRITHTILAVIFLLNISIAITEAITINTHDLGGPPLENMQGDGSWFNAIKFGAAPWENALLDSFKLDLFFNRDSSIWGGQHILLQQSGNPNREHAGLISIGTGTPLYIPQDCSTAQYSLYTEYSVDLGGGIINTGRIYNGATGQAASNFERLNLCQIITHEIGHALNLGIANSSFQQESSDGSILITDPLPFAGTMLPLAFNNFGVTSHLDAIQLGQTVMGGIAADAFYDLTDADILAVAQLGKFTMVNLPSLPFNPDLMPGPVPEPPMWLLFTSGIILIMVWKRYMHKKIQH